MLVMRINLTSLLPHITMSGSHIIYNPLFCIIYKAIVVFLSFSYENYNKVVCIIIKNMEHDDMLNFTIPKKKSCPKY